MAIIDKEEEKYEKPDVTKIVHALIIYALVFALTTGNLTQ